MIRTECHPKCITYDQLEELAKQLRGRLVLPTARECRWNAYWYVICFAELIISAKLWELKFEKYIWEEQRKSKMMGFSYLGAVLGFIWSIRLICLGEVSSRWVPCQKSGQNYFGGLLAQSLFLCHARILSRSVRNYFGWYLPCWSSLADLVAHSCIQVQI